MKPLLIVKSLTWVISLFFLFSCEKKTATTDNTQVPPPRPSGTDTGIYYSAKTTCNFDESGLTLTGWTKTFEDNFDSNLSNWSIYSGGSESRELQYYKESNVVVQNGALQIIAKKENATTTVNGASKEYAFTSGQIQSKSTFSANANTPKVKIVARIKLPKGFGLQPAFLTIGDKWPTQGQVNMIMASGNLSNFYATNYYYGTTVGNNLVSNGQGYITADADLSACYHVYEMDWTQNSLSFYLDGKLVEQKTSGGYIPQLYGTTQRLSFYLAISSDLIMRPQIQPGTLLVDWVKVYTSK